MVDEDRRKGLGLVHPEQASMCSGRTRNVRVVKLDPER